MLPHLPAAAAAFVPPRCPLVARRVWHSGEQEASLPPPTRVVAASGDDDSPALLLLLAEAERKGAVLMPLPSSPPSLPSPPSWRVAACVEGVVSAASVAATRAAPSKRRDLLLLHDDGVLRLYAGTRGVGEVELPPAEAVLPPLPPQLPSSSSAPPPPTTMMVAGLADDAVGSRVTAAVVERLPAAASDPSSQPSRRPRRAVVRLDFSPATPCSPLPARLLSAAALVLPTAEAHTLCALTVKQSSSAGGGGGGGGDEKRGGGTRAARQLAAFERALLSWATGKPLSAFAAHSPAAAASSSSPSSNSSPWERLRASPEHSELLSTAQLPWLGSQGATTKAMTAAPQPLSVAVSTLHPLSTSLLSALHAVYEDLKLNALEWCHLRAARRGLQALAGAVAAVARGRNQSSDLSAAAVASAAASYCDLYSRDAGGDPCFFSFPPRVRFAPDDGAPSPSSRPRQEQQKQRMAPLRPPADIHACLRAAVLGDDRAAEAAAPDPAVVAAAAANWGSPSSRSAAVLSAYGALCEAAAECRELLAKHDCHAGAGERGWRGATGASSLAGALRRSLERAGARAASALASRGWAPSDLDALPPGVSAPLRTALRASRAAAGSIGEGGGEQRLSVRALVLLGRDDVAATVAAAAGTGTCAQGGRKRKEEEGEEGEALLPAATTPAAAAAAALPRQQPAAARRRRRLSVGGAAGAPPPPTQLPPPSPPLLAPPPLAEAAAATSAAFSSAPSSSSSSSFKYGAAALSRLVPPHARRLSCVSSSAAAALASGGGGFSGDENDFEASSSDDDGGDEFEGRDENAFPSSSASASASRAAETNYSDTSGIPAAFLPWSARGADALTRPLRAPAGGLAGGGGGRRRGRRPRSRRSHRPPLSERQQEDGRLAAVAALLDASRPAAIRAPAAYMAQPNNGGDAGARALQERLTAHAVRALSAPVGRGALTLGSRPPPPAAPLLLPPLCMSGILSGGVPTTGIGGEGSSPSPVVVALDVSAVPPAPGGGAASELTAWAEFHNGVAAGLALARFDGGGEGGGGACSSSSMLCLADRGASRGGRGRSNIGGINSFAADAADRAWLAHARPSSNQQLTYAHAGLLLGAGLGGRLRGLPQADVYRYLATEHSPTGIGLLIGVAASRVGSCHAQTARALLLHVPSRLQGFAAAAGGSCSSFAGAGAGASSAAQHPAFGAGASSAVAAAAAAATSAAAAAAAAAASSAAGELEVSPAMQAAALTGIGLLFLDSGHGPTASMLLEELGKRPMASSNSAPSAGPVVTVGPDGTTIVSAAPSPASRDQLSHDGEAYSLCAGLALGMVCLGRGGRALRERLVARMGGPPAPPWRHSSLNSSAGPASKRRGGGGRGRENAFPRLFDDGNPFLSSSLAVAAAPAGAPPHSTASISLEDRFASLLRGGGAGVRGTAAGSEAGGRQRRGGGGDPAPPPPPPASSATTHHHDAEPATATLILDGTLPNSVATTPGAAAALALSHLRTGDAGAAAALAPPSTAHELRRSRPDLVGLKVLARALVRWDGIRPSEAWLREQLPPAAAEPLEELMLGAAAARGGASLRSGGGGGGAGASDAAAPNRQQQQQQPAQLWRQHRRDSLVIAADKATKKGAAAAAADANKREAEESPRDMEAACLCHISCLSGAALAMGLRFAGTQSAAAASTLHSLVLRLLAVKCSAPDASSGTPAVWGRADRADLESAACAAALALSAVLSGSGDLAALRLLRGLRRRLTLPGGSGSVSHGSHVASSLALGILFLGGGRLSLCTSPRATAALLAALWPALPFSPPDQRQHLQALRHLYALAASPRRLEVVDAATRMLTRAAIDVEVVLEEGGEEQERGGRANVAGGGGGESPRPPRRTGILRLVAPCLLPERDLIVSISPANGKRQSPLWPCRLRGEQLEAVLRSRRLYVRRAAGAEAVPVGGGSNGDGTRGTATDLGGSTTADDATTRLAAAIAENGSGGERGPGGGAAAVGVSPAALAARFGADPGVAAVAALVGARGWWLDSLPSSSSAAAAAASSSAAAAACSGEEDGENTTAPPPSSSLRASLEAALADAVVRDAAQALPAALAARCVSAALSCEAESVVVGASSSAAAATSRSLCGGAAPTVAAAGLALAAAAADGPCAAAAAVVRAAAAAAGAASSDNHGSRRRPQDATMSVDGIAAAADDEDEDLSRSPLATPPGSDDGDDGGEENNDKGEAAMLSSNNDGDGTCTSASSDAEFSFSSSSSEEEDDNDVDASDPTKPARKRLLRLARGARLGVQWPSLTATKKDEDDENESDGGGAASPAPCSSSSGRWDPVQLPAEARRDWASLRRAWGIGGGGGSRSGGRNNGSRELLRAYLSTGDPCTAAAAFLSSSSSRSTAYPSAVVDALCSLLSSARIPEASAAARAASSAVAAATAGNSSSKGNNNVEALAALAAALPGVPTEALGMVAACMQ